MPVPWSPASISPDSFKTAAEQGYGIQLASPFTYRTYREEWIDKLAENIGVYEAECVKQGRDPKAAERMMLVPFFVDESAEKAQAIFRERVEWFYAKVTSNQQAVKGQSDSIRGYEFTMAESKKTLAGGYLSFDKLHAHGAAIADDPAGCAASLNDLRERLGITEFVLWTNIGGMSAENSKKAMRLLMEEVAPLVNEREAAAQAAE